MLKKLFGSKTPKVIVQAERKVIDSFEFILNGQTVILEIVTNGDLYELWLNENLIYKHISLYKVYRKALCEVEKINSKINSLGA